MAYFYKDIETYIQRITSPVRVQHAGPARRVARERWRSPPSIFNISEFANTPRRPAEGLRAQCAGASSHSGMASGATSACWPTTRRWNRRSSTSLTSSNGVITSSTTNDLVDLSRELGQRHAVLRRWHLQHPLHRFVPRQVHSRYPGVGGQRSAGQHGEHCSSMARPRGT